MVVLVVSADITLDVLSPYGRWLPLACRFSCVLDDVRTAARVSIGLMYGTQSCACWGETFCVLGRVATSLVDLVASASFCFTRTC